MKEQPSAGRSSVVERIRANQGSLSPAERKVADAVLRDPVDVIHLSVSELAELAGSSASSVVRMCVTLGLRGYQELKMLLARESFSVEKQVLAAIDANDSSAEAARKVVTGTAVALEQIASVVDFDQVALIAEVIGQAKRVLLGAVGTSSPVALDAAQRLVTLGIDARFISDVHAQHVFARMLTPGDVFLAVSHTGATKETLSAANAARAAGATVIALTSFATSPLTELAEHVLVAGSTETAYRVEAMASRIVHITVMDAIFVAIAVRNEKSSEHQRLAADVLIEHRI